MRVIEKTVFLFDELSDAAKRVGFDVDEIYWQGDGAYSTGCAAAVARECPRDSEIQRIARAWQDLQRRNFYQIRANEYEFDEDGGRA